MQRKRVAVHLDTETTKQHSLKFKDDAEYTEWVNICINALTGDPRGVLMFTTPFCIYKAQHIVAMEFSDPPPLNEKLSIGYRTPNPKSS